MSIETDTVEAFVQSFARALQDRDERACAALWGHGVRLTDSLTRVLVRYSFFDGAGAHLVDGELRCHVGVNISAEPNLAGLARSRRYAP